MIGWVSRGPLVPVPREGWPQGWLQSHLNGTSFLLNCEFTLPSGSRKKKTKSLPPQADAYFCPNACSPVAPPAALGDAGSRRIPQTIFSEERGLGCGRGVSMLRFEMAWTSFGGHQCDRHQAEGWYTCDPWKQEPPPSPPAHGGSIGG